MIYWELFLSFLQIGAFSFGGGYAAMPLIQSQVVELHQWMTMNEFADLVTIAEMTPGPIAVNGATFVGLQVAGMMGAFVATLGCILPSCILVSVLAWAYMKYRSMKLMQSVLGALRPAVVAMIAGAGISILISAFWVNGVVSANLSDIQVRAIAIFAVAVLLLKKTKWNPIVVMVLCGVAEVICQAVMGQL